MEGGTRQVCLSPGPEAETQLSGVSESLAHGGMETTPRKQLLGENPHVRPSEAV